jgi:hypothetical protein
MASRPPDPATSTVTPKVPPGELLKGELIWRDNYDWLKERGYILRRRYEPNWVPSWRGTKKYWDECEDGLLSNVSFISGTKQQLKRS